MLYVIYKKDQFIFKEDFLPLGRQNKHFLIIDFNNLPEDGRLFSCVVGGGVVGDGGRGGLGF
jgi:hypothetical protein